MKRAQGLPINTIILAVLGLAVLVILLFLVSGKLSEGSKKYGNITQSAEEQAKSQDVCESVFAYPQRKCLSSSECTQRNGFDRPGYKGCSGSTVCCELG